jgi:hypothetical protein
MNTLTSRESLIQANSVAALASSDHDCVLDGAGSYQGTDVCIMYTKILRTYIRTTHALSPKG